MSDHDRMLARAEARAMKDAAVRYRDGNPAHFVGLVDAHLQALRAEARERARKSRAESESPPEVTP